VKRDTALRVDPRIDCLAGSKFGDNQARTGHGAELQEIASTLFHLDEAPCLDTRQALLAGAGWIQSVCNVA
jgi:hypothetical protein